MRAPTQAVVLVGGLGSRLGSLTQKCPKPLLPINGEPFLSLLISRLQRFGFERVILSAGYLAEEFRVFVAERQSQYKIKLEVIAEDGPLGTGGAIRRIIPALDETFLLMNGDSIFDFNILDLVPLLNCHASALVAMSLRLVDDASRFGRVEVDEEMVTGFSVRGANSAGLINAGIYLVQREIVQYLPEIGSFEETVLTTLSTLGKVCGRGYKGFFIDIGIPAAYKEAAVTIESNEHRCAVFFDRDGVLNYDYGHVGSLERFEWIAGAIRAVKAVNDAGLFAFVVSNQAGVAKGYYNENSVNMIHNFMQYELRQHGAHIDAYSYCPHHTAGVIARFKRDCSCRKPRPGMIFNLLKTWSIEQKGSFLIGDHMSDLEAGREAGIESHHFAGGELSSFVDHLLACAKTDS